MTNLYTKFDDDVRATIGGRIRASDEDAAQFWSSLANASWFHESAPTEEVGYSFRAAGGFIAEIRCEGDYMDWYCSGPDGVVAPWVSEALAKLGWRAEVFPSGATYGPELLG